MDPYSDLGVRAIRPGWALYLCVLGRPAVPHGTLLTGLAEKFPR